jgi:hypothetical protein
MEWDRDERSFALVAATERLASAFLRIDSTISGESNFVEVYNENLNDLLGNPDELDKKKHEIRHDMQRGRTAMSARLPWSLPLSGWHPHS